MSSFFLFLFGTIIPISRQKCNRTLADNDKYSTPAMLKICVFVSSRTMSSTLDVLSFSKTLASLLLRAASHFLPGTCSGTSEVLLATSETSEGSSVILLVCELPPTSLQGLHWFSGARGALTQCTTWSTKS